MFRRIFVFVALFGIASIVAASDQQTVSRVFRLQFVSVSEASAAVQPMLSEAGSLTLQPKLARIVVQDEPDIIERITLLIQQLDHVPGTFRVQIELLEGGEPKPYGSVDEIEVEGRLRKMFKVEAWHRIGVSTIEGVFGDGAQAELGPSYRISFVGQLQDRGRDTPWGAPDPGDRIQLRQLVLERGAVAADGTLLQHELLRTNVMLSTNQTVFIGAGNSEGSKNVLVLIVRAQDFGSP